MEAIIAFQELAHAKEKDGDSKQAYHLYVKALLLICEELQRAIFVDESSISTTSPTTDFFALARQCLRNAESIKNSSGNTNNRSDTFTPSSLNVKSPPPIPPKPTFMRKPIDSTVLKDSHVNHSPIKRWKVQSEVMVSPETPTKLTIPQFQVTNPDAIPETWSKFQESPDILPVNNVKIEISRKILPLPPPSQGSVATLRRKLDTVIYRRASSPNLSTSFAQTAAVGSRRGSGIKGMLSLPHLSRGESRSLADKGGQSLSIFGLPSDGSTASFFQFDNSIDISQTMPAPTLQDENLAVHSTQKGSDNVPRIPVPPLQIIYRHLQDPESTKRYFPDLKLAIPDLSAKALAQRAADAIYLDVVQSKTTSEADRKALVSQLHTLHVSAAMVQSILHFQPHLVAYQLTLIDSAIFRAIRTDALIEHSPKTPHTTIVASTDFFNYLTRFIEHCILLPQEASVRAQHVNHWIKIASKCLDLRNYQTLKAIVSSLGTPPIQRLKRTWSFVPKKSLTRLETLNNLMSESCNYRRYRERLILITESDQKATEGLGISKPIVPFLGTFIHDVTYIIAFIKSYRGPSPLTSISTPTARVNSKTAAVTPKTEPIFQQCDISAAEKLMLQQDQRFVELARTFEQYQSCPDYLPTLPHQFIKSMHKSRKTRFSDALKSASSNKRGLQTSEDDKDDMPLSSQQAIITQYLLTRSWVTEKVIDELSMIREPSQKLRSNSESSSHLTSSFNSNTTSISVSSTSSIITCKSNSIGGFRSSSGSYDSDNPCTSGDDPIPIPDVPKIDLAAKGIEVRTEALTSSDRKENKNLWSFTWRRGSVDDSHNGHDETISLPVPTNSDQQEFGGRNARSKIWTDEFWQGSKKDSTIAGFRQTHENGTEAIDDGDATTPGINLLRSHRSISPKYQRSHSEATASPSWSYKRTHSDIKPTNLLVESLAPWHPVDDPEPL